MRYDTIRDADKENRRKALRQSRQIQLYRSIFTDIAAILKILLPSDKAMVAGQHIKSIMYALIELKTGKRPDKF